MSEQIEGLVQATKVMPFEARTAFWRDFYSILRDLKRTKTGQQYDLCYVQLIVKAHEYIATRAWIPTTS